MGWVLFRLGKAEEAVGYLEKARALRNDPEVAAHLGEVLWSLGRQAEARAVWDAALKLAPEDPRVLKTMERLTR
jgi:Flp pilus assembly protein TadD